MRGGSKQEERVMNTAPRTLDAAGSLHAIAGSGWVGIADRLARVPDDEFERLVAAFRLYREAHGQLRQTGDKPDR